VEPGREPALAPEAPNRLGHGDQHVLERIGGFIVIDEDPANAGTGQVKPVDHLDEQLRGRLRAGRCSPGQLVDEHPDGPLIGPGTSEERRHRSPGSGITGGRRCR
jgi:hypothetical protein